MMKMNQRLPLHGIKVLEFAGLAPGPMCGKVLSDFGASVLKVDREGIPNEFLHNSKRSIFLNLKKPSAVEVAKKLCNTHDVLIDPFRPGILEKFGLGPLDVMKNNPRIIYARITGFGQTGPLSQQAGHDINYVSLSGVLSMLRRKDEKPTPPINLLADFAGGGILCAMGIALALLERTNTGVGKIVDCSMTEGAAYVSSFLFSSQEVGYLWNEPPGENLLDTGRHFYDTYETKDGRYMAVGPIEPKFYQLLLEGLQLNPDDVPHMYDFDENKAIIARRFKEKTQQEWTKIFEGSDACVTPVLTLQEATDHPHARARKNFRRVENHFEPTSSPKLNNLDGSVPEDFFTRMKDYPSVAAPGAHTVEVLRELKYSQEDIDQLLQEEAVMQSSGKAKL